MGSFPDESIYLLRRKSRQIIVNVSTSLEKLQCRLGYQFNNTELAQLALTHRSCGGKNNERLEFLGDSIVNFIIADALYEKFPRATEGQLSRLRACLVRGATLAEISRGLDLGEFLRLGIGEMKSGGHRRASILADVVESLIGAIYLDGGMNACRERVLHWFSSRIEISSIDDQRNKDPKTRLQEWLQSQQRTLPQYELIDVSGQAHDQTFRVECRIEEFEPMIGESNSRRGAEQNAAQQILSAAGVEDRK